MRTLIYNATAPNIVEAEYDEELKCIIVTWYNMLALDDLDPCSRAQINTIKKYNAKSIIMNTSNAKNTIRKDDMEWIETFYFPRLIHAGLKDIIIIPSVSAITKEAMENYKDIAEKNGLTTHTCADMKSAILLANSIKDKVIN